MMKMRQAIRSSRRLRLFVMGRFYLLLVFAVIGGGGGGVDASETNELQQLKSQINALIVQRQDDSSKLETIARSWLNKDAEIDQLRSEIRDLRMELDSIKTTKSWSLGCSDGGSGSEAGSGCGSSNRMKNEQLTVEWVSNSISEIRAEMAEMLKSFDSTATLQQRQVFSTDISILQNDVVSLRHSVEHSKADAAKFNAKLVALTQDVDALKQSTSSVAAKVVNFTQQIRVFSAPHDDNDDEWFVGDGGTMKPVAKGRKPSAVFKKMIVLKENPLEMRVLTSTRRVAYERRRHRRPRSQSRSRSRFRPRRIYHNDGGGGGGGAAQMMGPQEHDQNQDGDQADEEPLQLLLLEEQLLRASGRSSSGIVDSISKLGKRVEKLESVTERWTSRSKTQDYKLRSSMLELLEAIENIEAKFDNVTPTLKKEISKMEFSLAQIVANLSATRQHQQEDRLSATTMAENLSKTQSKLARHEYQLSVIEEKFANVLTFFNSCSNFIQKHLVAGDPLTSAGFGFGFGAVNLANRKSDADADGAIGNVTLLATAAAAAADAAAVSQLRVLRNQYDDFVRRLPTDCDQVDDGDDDGNGNGGSGLRLISVDFSTPILVFCETKWSARAENETANGANYSSSRQTDAYIVIQRRSSGLVDFNRNWEEYARGFGNLRDEFWLGNELIRRLTKNNDTGLRIELADETGRRWYAEYDTFSVASRQRAYELYVDGFSGNATNAFQYHNRMRFSTKDSDHDASDTTNCAANYECGWWYSHCQQANLNAKPNTGRLTWFDSARNEWIALSSTKMMLTKRKRS